MLLKECNGGAHEVCKIDFLDNLGSKGKTDKFECPPLFTGKVSKIDLFLPGHRRKIPILHTSCGGAGLGNRNAGSIFNNQEDKVALMFCD